jgi:VanZ family protein
MKHWIPAVVYSILIFVLSQQSSIPGADLAPDYVEHFLEYGILALTVVWGLTAGLTRRLTPRLAGIAFGACSAYGCTDEFHQLFVAGRFASLSDIAADALGAGCFTLGAFLLTKLWLRRAVSVPREL